MCCCASRPAKLVTDPNRMQMSDGSYYLKSRAEMETLFGQYPGALDNTLLVAEMCEVNLKSKGYHLPMYQVPEGHTAQSYLRDLCEAGLRQRYGARADEPEVRAAPGIRAQGHPRDGLRRLFPDRVGPVPLRAVARHLVERARLGRLVDRGLHLGITSLDPLRNSLIFERFLNPGRISMPDIDLDFPDDRRAEMIEYTVQKYGQDKVAQIITFGTLGARAAIRDIGRAMDIPLNEVDKIAKLVPAGPKVKLKDAFDNLEFKDAVRLAGLYPPVGGYGRPARGRQPRMPPPTPPASSFPTGRWWSTCRSTGPPRAPTSPAWAWSRSSRWRSSRRSACSRWTSWAWPR